MFQAGGCRSGETDVGERRDMVIGSGGGKAAEHDPTDTARREGQFGSDRADRNARCTTLRKPINAGRDRGKGDRRKTVLGGKVERRAIARGQKLLLPLTAPLHTGPTA